VRRLGLVLLTFVLGTGALVATALPSGAGQATLDDITVNGGVGEAPTLDFEAPFATKKSADVVVVQGEGAKSKKGQTISFDLAVFNGRSGDQIESSFGQGAQSVTLDPKQTFKGLVNGLTGVATGSRVLIAISPKEGLAERLISQQVPNLKKSDTILFVVDLNDAHDVLERAEGEAVVQPEGQPAVKLGKNGKPKITTPDGDAPTELIVQPLITGTGPVVEAGQTITVHYTGVLWGSDKKFDSSWDRGEPASFPIGTGQVIAGWDEGLVGQTVGSQILLVVPPDKGYGEAGNPSGGISGTDTLVFVVDILDAT
jgi:peptidylprolyl isomerase